MYFVQNGIYDTSNYNVFLKLQAQMNLCRTPGKDTFV